MSPGRGGSLQTIEGELWDAVVVGTGMGGATLGLVLARAGRSVLFLEKGQDLAGDAPAIRGIPPEAAAEFARTPERALARSGRSTEALHDAARDQSFLPEIGCGTGGSTSIYGAVLERLFPGDFAPGVYHRDEPSACVPEAWPITYEELRPWYARAETLFGVRGGPDPLRLGFCDLLPPSAPLAPGTQAVVEALATRGAHAYPLPLACEQAGACEACQGYLCPRACKNDASRVGLAPALRLGATLLAECEAVRIEADSTRVRSLVCKLPERTLRVRGKIVVLACGAIYTPALLLASSQPGWENGIANGSGLVGRCLMRHCVDVWALRDAPPLAQPGEAKSIGFNDLYASEDGKLGTVQSFGAAPPLPYLRRQQSASWFWRLGPLSELLWRAQAQTRLMAAILEDLGYPDNRVLPMADGRVSIMYRRGRSEGRRRRRFRERLRELFRGLGATLVSGESPPKALGHACGTCRFGVDPRSSVLDRDNRAHELDNLYVVDASFFPSSGGINPALTVAANALRVGTLLVSRLR